jgi:phage-related minor tail protein
MAQDKTKIQAEIELSTANAEQGFAKVASSAEKMSSSIKRSGKEAGDGLSGVGDGGDKASAKVDRATSSMIASIQRATVAYESGGRSTAKYYETVANQRGISVDALRPYLSQLEQVSKTQVNTGMSAAAMSAAMRNVPAQFTDIAVSLQGGQKPLTVFLQQGGQLKDMFGGIGPAAKALGGYVLGLINPFTLAVGAVGALGAAYYYGSEQSKALERSLIVSGNYAGTTSAKLNEVAEKVGLLTGKFSEARDVVTSLAESGNFSFSAIQNLSESIVAASAVTGKSIKDTVAQFEKLKDEPTKAILELNKSYNFLTVDIYKQIKALEARGEKEKAASLASNVYSDSVLTKNAKIVENLGYIESAWKGIAEESKNALDTFLGFGRASSDTQKLIVARNQLASMKQTAGNVSADSGAAKEIASQEALIKTIESRIQTNAKLAKSEGDAAVDRKKTVDSLAKYDDYIAKGTASQRQLALDAAKNDFEKAIKGVEKGTDAYKKANDIYLDIDNKIKKQFEVKKEKLSQEENAYKSLAKTIQEKLVVSQIELSTGKALSDSQSLRIKLMDLIAGGHSKISAAQIQESEKSIFLMRSNELARKSYDDLEKSLKSFKASFTADDIVKSLKAQNDAYFDIANAQEKYRDSLAESNDLVQLEMQLMGVSSADRNTAIEQYKIELALKKELLKIDQDSLLTNDEKKDRSDYAKESANIAKSQAGLKAQQQEWSKFYTDIYNGLSDSLYRGFEAGKGFFQNFWDGIKNLFKTTVLKLAVQGVMTGVLGLGANGAATAQGLGGFGSAASTFSTGKSLWEGFSAASSIGGGVANILGTPIASLGAALGSTTLSAFASGLTGVGAAGANSIAAASFAAKSAALSSGLTGSAVTSAGTAAGATTAGGIGAGISSALAAIPVWGWAALAAVAVASAFGGGKDRVTGAQSVSGTLGTNNLTRNVDWTKDGGWFNSNTSGTWNYSLANSTAQASNGQFYQDTANVANDQKLLTQLNLTYDAIKMASGDYATALGLNADLITSRVDKMSFALGKTQEEIDKAIQAMFGTIADDMAKTLIPSIAEMTKEGETASQALGRIATGFGTANAIFTDLQLTLFKVGEDGYKASSAFVDLVGGVDALKAASTSYYENFYTQEERNASIVKSLTAEFEKQALVLPTTREGYRALVESISKTGTPEQLAALFKLNGAFASVFEATTNLSTASENAAAALKLQADIAQERAGLQDEYNRLTMTGAQLLDLQKSSLFESNKALFDSINAIKEKTAAEEAAAQSTARIAQERASLQDSLDQLLMSPAQLLAKQKSQYDVSNQGIFDQLQTATTAKQQAEALKGVNESVQQQINDLIKSTLSLDEVRASELVGLDQSTAALKKRLYALQDESKMTEQLKVQSQARADSFSNLMNSLVSGIGDTAKSFEKLAETMKQARDSLIVGDNSGFDIKDRLALMREQIANATESQLPGLSNEYLSLLKNSGVGGVDYQREFSGIVNRLDAYAINAQSKSIVDYSGLAGFGEALAKQKETADFRAQFGAEYGTYAQQIQGVRAIDPQYQINLQRGNRFASLDQTLNTNDAATNKELLEEIRRLRQASEATAAMLSSGVLLVEVAA